MTDTDYFCMICNKKYSSYQSLWRHNNKFHLTNSTTLELLKNNNEHKCINCSKIFKSMKSKTTHENKCVLKKMDIKKVNNIKELLENEIFNKLKHETTEIIRLTEFVYKNDSELYLLTFENENKKDRITVSNIIISNYINTHTILFNKIKSLLTDKIVKQIEEYIDVIKEMKYSNDIIKKIKLLNYIKNIYTKFALTKTLLSFDAYDEATDDSDEEVVDILPKSFIV